MKITIAGVLAEIGEEKKFASGFAKKQIVVLEGGSAERPLPMTVSHLRYDQLKDAKVGMEVEISAILSAHKWNDRHYLDIGVRTIKPLVQPKKEPVSPAPPLPPRPEDKELESLPF